MQKAKSLHKSEASYNVSRLRSKVKIFLFAVFFMSFLSICHLRLSMYVFCDVKTSSESYVVIHEEDAPECTLSSKKKMQLFEQSSSTVNVPLWYGKLSKESKEKLCRGTYRILHALSQNLLFFLPHSWVLPPTSIQLSCLTTQLPKEKKKSKGLSRIVVTSIHRIKSIFTRKKKRSW